MTADATRIGRQLEDRDIALFAADEPMTANATAILTRRVKQGVAEWYVRDLIEKSRRGMEESARKGWHTGGPVPCGYQLEAHPYPNPHKAREGKKKHRLVPDPVRAPIVAMILEDYCLRGMGLSEICDKLNRDLERYPPPKRNRKDEMPLRQTWSRSQIQAMLRNPKYTGYNVWGWRTSTAPSTARRSGWRSTRIPATPSSPSPPGASRSSAPAAPPSRRPSAASKYAGPTAPGPTRSRPCSPLCPTSGPVSRPPARKSAPTGSGKTVMAAAGVPGLHTKAPR
jgi:DNA invertase Pin-like site-specific DNA recombinase